MGQLVGAGTTTLATIVQLNPIYVNFNVSEKDVLRIRADMAKRGITAQDLKKMPVEVGLQNETGYPHKGTLDYAAPNLTAATGTLAVRAVLPNADRAAAAGLFRARARAARRRARTCCSCRTAPSAATRAAAMCWSPARTTSSSSARSRSASWSASCG